MMKRWMWMLVGILISIQVFGQESVTVDRPWNGYWWPFEDGALVTGIDFRNRPSAMEKYDLIFQQNGQAVQWELERHYDPDAPYWFGHCNGWAAASVLEQEPEAGVTYSYMTFSTGELKGLLTEASQGSIGSVYGTAYRDASNDFSDIDPLDFQTVLQLYLRDNGIPIIMDADPGVEVWSYPIFAYELDWTDDGSTRHVTCTVRCATDGVMPDSQVNTEFVKTYTYDLYLDGGTPVGGDWTGGSVDDHPDFLWYPDFQRSANPYVRASDVRELVAGTLPTDLDDPVEPNDALPQAGVPAPAGIQRLLNADWFRFDIEKYQRLQVQIGFNDPDYYEEPALWNEAGEFLSWIEKDGATDMGMWTVETENQDLRRVLSIDTSGLFDGNYLLDVSVVSRSAYVSHVDMNPYWTMVSLWRSTDSEPVSAQFYIGSAESATSMGDPTILSKHTFREISSADLPSQTQWLKVNTLDAAVSARTLYRSGNNASLGLWDDSEPETNFVLPHVPDNMDYWWYGLVLLNTSGLSEAHVKLTAYNHQGGVLAERELDLNTYEKRVGLYEEFFPDIPVEQLAFFMGSSSEPLMVSSLYGTRDHDELSYVNISGQDLSGLWWVPMDLIDTANAWYGIALVNPGTIATQVYFRWYVEGEPQYVYQEQRYIGPKEKLLSVLSDLMPEWLRNEPVKRLEIDVINGSLRGLVLAGDHQEEILSTVPFMPAHYSTGISMPVRIAALDCNMHVVISNQQTYADDYLVELVDEDGNQVAHVLDTLPAYGRIEHALGDWFSQVQLDSASTIRVACDRGLLVCVALSGGDGFYELVPPDVLTP